MAQRYTVSGQHNQNTVSIGTSNTTVLAANANRKGLILSNTGANNIYVNLAGGTPTTGSIMLPPNSQPLVLLNLVPTGIVYALAATGATNLAVDEIT